MWEVVARGAESGFEYVYQVDAPADATPMTVVCRAYGAHGAKFRAGEVAEKLAPGGFAQPVSDRGATEGCFT